MSDLSAEGRASAPALQILCVGTDIPVSLDGFAEAVTGEVRILENRADADPRLAPVLVLALDPVTDLALRLSGRTDAEEVLSEWAGAASSLLKWHGQSRRRITLCDIRTLAEAGAGVLMERLGVSAEPPEPIAEVLLPQPTDFDLLTASVLLDSDRQASAIAEQLTASMIGPGRIAISGALVRRLRVDRQDLDARLDDVTRTSEAERQQAQTVLSEKEQDLANLRGEMDRLVTERDLLNENLGLQMEAATTAAAEAETVRGELEARTSEASQLRTELSERERDLANLRGEMDRLVTERDLLNENLGLQMEAATTAVAEAETVRGELEARTSEASQLRTELSERERDLANLRGEMDKLARERDLLNENLASQMKGVTSAKAEAEARNVELTQLRTELAEKEQALATLRDELDRTGTERDLLRENLGLQMEMIENPGAAEMEREIADLRNRMVDFHLLKAENEAMERRLAEAQERQARREAVLTAQILLDGLPPWKA